MAYRMSSDGPELIEGVVDHLLHISYDERTVLRQTVTKDRG